MSETKEKKDIEEIRLLLLSNCFEELTEENEERIDNFFTPFQIKLRLKVPLDNKEYSMALQYLGIRGYYEGHSIPMNPDNTAFMVKEGKDGDKYIQIFARKSMLEEIEDFINEDEMFNQYMKERCKKDFEAIFNNNDFIALSILTSGPSENFSHLITYGACEIKENKKTERKSHIFVDNRLTEEEIKDYITPYKEGVKSSYEQTGVALPQMEECKNPMIFTDPVNSLRTYYKICSKKIVVSDDTVKVKNFFGKLLEKNNLPEEYGIDVIAKDFVSIRRLSKYLFDEYLTIYQLAKLLNYTKLLNYGSIGESEIVSDLIVLLKKNMEKTLKDKEKREMEKY